MKQIEIYNFTESVVYSHIYGNTSTNKTETLMRTAVISNPEKLHFVCFRTKAETQWRWDSTAMADEGRKQYRFGINAGKQNIFNLDTDKLIFCTPSKLITMLLTMKKSGTLGKLGWVMIEGWDMYDANAFAAVGLLKYLRGDMEIEFRLVLLSVSKYAELPLEKAQYKSMEIPSGLKIEYKKEDPIKTINSLRKNCIVYLGNKYLERGSDMVVVAKHPMREKTIQLVVDSMKDINGKPITKHMADLRADSIDSGVVIRCVSYQVYSNLHDSKVTSKRLGFEECVLRLYQEGLPVNDLFPKSHSQLIKNFLSSVQGVNIRTISDINRYKLSLEPGIFLNNWLIQAKTDRDFYVGALVSCLINTPPSVYGPIESFKPFVGRNNIETLCNFWVNVTSVSTIPLSKLDTPRDIFKWCDDNNFDSTKVSDLVKKVTELYMKITKKIVGNESFASVTTEELNRVKDTITRRLAPVKGGKWDLSQTLPPKNKKTLPVIPILESGNKLLIYINDVDLADRTIENLDAFL